MTWTSAGSAVGTWGTGSNATDEGWRRLSVVTDAQAGVDFQLKVNDQHPDTLWDHDPLTLIDAPQETP